MLAESAKSTTSEPHAASSLDGVPTVGNMNDNSVTSVAELDDGTAKVIAESDTNLSVRSIAGLPATAASPVASKQAEEMSPTGVEDSLKSSNSVGKSENLAGDNSIRNATARMMAVYEVTVDASARDGDVLNVILQKNGLGAVEDLVLDETQLTSVLKSGIVGPATSDGNAQVLVLKGTASMLSRFYDDLEKSYEDFPRLRMNAVMDDSVGMIEGQMSSMRVTATSGTVGRLGASRPGGIVSSFSKGSAKFMDVPLEQRRQSKRREPGGDLDPISYVMLVVRTAE